MFTAQRGFPQQLIAYKDYTGHDKSPQRSDWNGCSMQRLDEVKKEVSEKGNQKSSIVARGTVNSIDMILSSRPLQYISTKDIEESISSPLHNIPQMIIVLVLVARCTTQLEIVLVQKLLTMYLAQSIEISLLCT